MFTFEELDNIILDLENSLQTYSDCQRLADLYIIRNELKNKESQHVDIADSTSKELDDILPRFRNYCMIKKKYQMNELPKDTLIHAMNDVCKELSEFITTLYSCTEDKLERKAINDMMSNLCKNLFTNK